MRLVVFESSPDFSDNSRAMYEYLKEKNDYKLFWCVRDELMLSIMKQNDIDCALFGSELAEKMIASADVFITSSFEFAYYKKKNQLHLSCWHGFPLKLIGFFESSNGNQNFENLKIITAQSDIILASSRFCQLTMSGMLNVNPNKVKITGFPRNDLLFLENGKKNLNKLLNIDMNSKFILYLPTMRKGLKNEGMPFSDNIFNYTDYDSNKIDEFLEQNNAYIITKMHFADNAYYNNGDFKLPKRMIFLKSEDLNQELFTIYHIMNAFDVLITDYSSVYVDYLLLNRPIIFSCPDIEVYKKDRGFVIDDPTILMPGEIVKSQKDLLSSLRNILNDRDEYKNLRNEKMSFFYSSSDSKSCYRVEKLICDDFGKDFDKKMGCIYLPHHPLYKYHLHLNSEFYFDKGNGLTEDDKHKVNRELSDSNEKIIYELNALENVKYIRFDPDINGHWIVKDLSISADSDILKFDVVNGIKVDDVILFLENDPQIHIDFHEKRYTSIKFEFEILDVRENLENLNSYVKEMKYKNEEFYHKLESIYNSKYWKVAEPLRKVHAKRRKD